MSCSVQFNSNVKLVKVLSVKKKINLDTLKFTLFDRLKSVEWINL